MNAHVPLLHSTAVPVTSSDDTPAPTWDALRLELRDAKADWQAKAHLTNSVTLGREPTEHELAVGIAAQGRDLAAIHAVHTYQPASLTEFLEKAALFSDPHLHLGMNEAAVVLARDAQGLQAADGQLLRLDEQLGIRAKLEQLVCESKGSPDEAATAMVAWTGEVAEQIMALPPAVTIKGMRAKARAIAWSFSEDRTAFSGPHVTTAAERWADRFFAELLHGSAGAEEDPYGRPASTAVQVISDDLQEARARTRQADQEAEGHKAAGDQRAQVQAEAAFSHLADAEAALEDQLLAEPSRSFADVLIKAQLAADHGGGTVCEGIPELVSGDDLGTIAARAVVRDLCALVGRIVPELSEQVAF